MRFLQQLQQDVRLFLYMNGLIMLFRLVFILLFSSQLNDNGVSETWLALWYGLRISLKTTGIIVAVPFLFASLPSAFCVKWPSGGIRKYWGAVCIMFFTFLFMARIPYYKIYTQGFNAMLINGLVDDTDAIIKTALDQYQLLPRLLGVAVLGIILVWLWFMLQKLPLRQFNKHIKCYIFSFAVILPFIFIFFRFGGGYSYDTGINWENAARTSSNLLNEAILDDGQALYRVWSIYENTNSNKTIKVTVEETQAALQILGGDRNAPSLDDGLKRISKGHNLLVKPKQIIFVLGENYALWPLLASYRKLDLMPTGVKLEKEGGYTYHFLANGNGTMTSLNGLLTGLVDVSLYPNYMSGIKNDNYPTGIGSMMKAAGYKTVFWYGGSGSWQNLHNYVLKQGFMEFYGAENFAKSSLSTWGVADEALFKNVEDYMAEKSEPTFHFILTSSNHPPYAMDVDSRGFQRNKVASLLPPEINSSKDNLNQLGHIWYADVAIGNFIDEVKKQYKDALFVVTGDHAERFSFAKEVSLEELNGVPCYFYGTGVTKEFLSSSSVGSHVQMIPTLAEMLLPKGSCYYSLLPPLQNSRQAFNYKLVIEPGEKAKMLEEKQVKDVGLKSQMNAARKISIRRMIDGRELQ